MTARGKPVSALWRQTAISAALACVFAAGQAQANGTDPAVVAGQVSFSTAGSSLSITNSPGAIINWQGFSIGASETTRFIQQSAASSVLNRVIGPDPSVILGTLTSNGRVFLINPSGILFGQGARIDVAGLVASTLNLSNQDFLAGHLNFAPNPLAGTVENQGSITTPSGGSVYLVGTNVSNSGIINSPQGDVILAAGQSVSIFDTSTPGVRVELTAGDNAAVNLGEILAKSGEVGIYGAALRNAGIIDADQVVRDASGKIVLRAKQDLTLEAGSRLSANGEQGGEITVQSETGTTLVSGTIEAKGTGVGQAGGMVHVLGDKVGLFGGHIDASGDAGGGTVLVGGDAHGQGTVPHASFSYVSADSTITADALTNGNGGNVVVWADQVTRYFGGISARGGLHGGDGGFVETSGLSSFVIGGGVDAGAPRGKGGMWLLDPFYDVNIAPTATDNGTFTAGVFSPNTTTALVDNGRISTALQTGDVTITTDNAAGTQVGNILVTGPVTRASSVGGPAVTTFKLLPSPTGMITVLATGNISGSSGNPLNVNLAATGGLVDVRAPITTFGGTFQSTGTTFTNAAGGPITTAGGTLTINQTGFVTISDNLSSSGGDISITGVGVTVPAAKIVNSGAGALSVNAGAGLLTTNATSYLLTTGTATLTADTMTLDAAGQIGGTGAGAGTATTVILQPSTAGTTIGLTTGAGTLNLTVEELDTVRATNVSIGNLSAGGMIMGTWASLAPLTFAPGMLTLQTGSGYGITQTGGITVNGASNINAGTITLTHAANIFTGAVSLTGGVTQITDVSNLTLGTVATGALTAISTGALNLGTGTVTGTLAATSNDGNITETAGGLTVTSTSNINAGTGSITLTDPLNDFQAAVTLIGSGASVSIKDTNALTLAVPTLGANTGITAVAGTTLTLPATTSFSTGTGSIDFESNGGALTTTGTLTTSGNITLIGSAGVTVSHALTSSNGSGTAIVVKAGNGTAAGTATGGDINIASGSISLTGAGGAILYTGNLSSAGVVAAAGGSGSGNFRYNSSPTTQNYSLVLNPAAVSAVFREWPTLTITANSPAAITYGAVTPSLTAAVTGLQNGDTLGQAFSTQASVADDGIVSGTGFLTAAAHTLTASSAVGQLGYALSYVAGTLTVNQRDITAVTGITAADKIYDGDTTAVLTTTGAGFTGIVVGELLTVGAATGTFNDKDVLDATTVNISGITLANGVNPLHLASNYNLTSTIASDAAIITVRDITAVTGITAADKTYSGDTTAVLTTTGAGFTGIVVGELLTVGAATGTFNDKDVLDATTVNISGITLANGVNPLHLASNYNLTSTIASDASIITQATLTIVADALGKVYGTADPVLTYTTGAFQFGDTAGSVLTGALSRAAEENVGSYAIGQNTLASNANYTIDYTGNNLGITPAPLNVAANPQNKLFGQSDPALTFSVTGLVNNPALGIADIAGSVLSGALTRVPGESALGGPYAITQGSLAANSNYSLGFTPNILIITGAAAEPVLGFNAEQVVFVGVINNEFYYRPGNFWHISLNPNNADPGFDVMRGTNDLKSRLGDRLNRCDSVSGGGFCETWSFPEQREKGNK